MNNNRGNRYSQEHQQIEINNCSDVDYDRFYDFSFQEFAMYDQPALWDYVTSITGEQKISYIGHSQGTSQMFAALAENPDFFRDRLKIFIAIAPVVLLNNMQCEIVHKLHVQIRATLKLMGPNIIPIPGAGNRIVDFVLNTQGGMKIAGSLSSIATDGNVDVMSHEGLEMHQKFFPAGTSFRCADHLRQLVFNEGKGFTKYDFLDPAEN